MANSTGSRMHNRFGVKDFVLVNLIALVGLLVFLNMRQTDRAWERNEDTLGRVKAIEGQIGGVDRKLSEMQVSVERASAAATAATQELAAVRQAIASGVTVKGSVPEATGGRGEHAAGNAPASSSGSEGRDASWARPGVPIQWQPPYEFATNPSKLPGFRMGGEITEIWEAQTKTLTPYISTDVYSRRVQELVMESLGIYDPVTLKPRGVLAEAWQVDPDGAWLRARIRAGARFSDGKPVTAEDLRWTFHDYIMNEQNEAERSRSIIRDSILKVEAIEERTVEFTFKEKLYSNVDNALGIFVLPKHVYGALSSAQINKSTGLLIGSGPFKIRNFDVEKQWAPPEDIVLERNEQYWGPRPSVANLRYKAINEEIGRLNAFFAGDADIITPAAPQFVAKQEDPEWQKKTQFLKWVNMRSGYSFIAWNCGERNGKLTPFHDKRVRRAMTLAIDREKMIRDIWKGIGVVAKGNQPLGAPGSNPDIKPWPFDPPAALALLKEAGWEDRDGSGVLKDKLGNEFAFEFTYAAGGEIAERLARFVKDSLTGIGLRVTLRGVEWSVYQDLLKTRDFDCITLGWGANAPESDPKQAFHSASIKNQGDNFTQWANADADRLIDEGRRELDDAKRFAIWRQLEAVLHDEQPYTFIRVPPWIRFASKQVGNINPYPKGLEPAEYFNSGAAAPKPGF
jgi:peptide/nickel transport system substrate-binding protein